MTQDHDTLRALDGRLAEVEKRVGALDRALDVAGDLTRTRTLARVLALVLAPTLAPAFDVAGDLARARAHARALALALDVDLDVAFDVASDLARAHTLALDVARNVARARAHDRALALARALALDLARDVEGNRALALDMAHRERFEVAAVVRGVRLRIQAELAAPTSDTTVPEGGVVVSPARSALRLLHGTLRVLPRRDQFRYREELEAELVELAAGGTSRRAQLAYALGLAGRAWALRRALRAPAPGRARERAR